MVEGEKNVPIFIRVLITMIPRVNHHIELITMLFYYNLIVEDKALDQSVVNW